MTSRLMINHTFFDFIFFLQIMKKDGLETLQTKK